MTEKTIKAFDQVCDAVTKHEDSLSAAEYLELLDELIGFMAVRHAKIQKQISEVAG